MVTLIEVHCAHARNIAEQLILYTVKMCYQNWHKKGQRAELPKLVNEIADALTRLSNEQWRKLTF